MNELTLLHKKLNFEFVLIEKPYFFINGKSIRSSPLSDGQKVLLKEVEGNDLLEIVVGLNKQHPDKEIAVICIGRDNRVTKSKDNGKVSIQCQII